jgi:NTE family protein
VSRLSKIITTITLFAFANSYSQTASIRNLVFEGAGIRGIAYSGAIRELESRNILHNVQRVGGTASGAITALLLSIGYSAEEIITIANSTPYKKFNDGRFFFIGGINRFQKYFGWYRGQQFEHWLSKLIEAKTGNADITFQQLVEKGYKDLYVTGTCLNKQSLVVFSNENYPAMKVRDAVRISMSIPLYFEAVFIDSKGNLFHHPKNKNGLDIMVDGGFTANFPIKIFDSTKYFDQTKPNTFASNPQTIGFRIDRNDQIQNDTSGKSLASFKINSLKDYFGAFYNIVIENLNRQTLTKEDWQRTVLISDGNVAPRVRKLSHKELTSLTDNGAMATERFLLNKN